MFFPRLSFIALALLLIPEHFANARGRGGGGGGGNGGEDPNGECDCVKIGSWRVNKTWFIVACVVIGLIVIGSVTYCLARTFEGVRDIFICCCGTRWERQQRKEAKRNKKNLKNGIIGQQGPYHQAAFVRLPQNQSDTWNSSKAQQAMGYGQGGLGYSHNVGKGSAPSTPPINPHVPPYSLPFHHHQASGSQGYIPQQPYSIPFTKQPNQN